MIIELSQSSLTQLVNHQIQAFFPLMDEEKMLIEKFVSATLGRCESAFIKSTNKYYKKNGEVYFNPFHSGQYTIFLYYLSNTIFRSAKESLTLADRIYYLNKIMNGCDLFYEVELPEIFFLDHPVGSVMGRAKYSNYFAFGQNCTVGNNKGIFPTIGKHVRMSANSMILGNCIIGNNVVIAANACVKDQNVPDNSLVFGQSPNLIIKNKQTN